MTNHTERRRLTEFKARLAGVSDSEIAWFAGWLCADGCINPGGNGGPAKLKFVLCDRDPLERFAALFGLGVRGPYAPSGFGKRPRYEWQITGGKALALLERCQPWLSDRYKERALRAAAHGPLKHGGRKLDPQQIASIRAKLATGRHGIGRALARKYNVSDGMISAIRSRRAWSCVSI